MSSALSPKKCYAILENLVFQGFDVIGLGLPGKSRLMLKTVNPREEALMRHRSGVDSVNIQKGMYMAYATYLVDGRNALAGNRESALDSLEAFYGSLPIGLVDYLLDAVLQLQARGYEAAKLLEGFAYSHRSRTIWRSVRRSGVNSDAITGIPGTGTLGLNQIQEAWVSYNEMLDSEEHDAEEMSHSVFIASASNPDGVKKASRQMEAKRRNSRELRDELALFGSNENRNIILNLFDHSRAGWAPKIVTNDDLIKELNKQMQGVKDKHDLFFEETYAERRRLAEEEEELRASEARRKYSEVSPDSVFQGSAHVTEEEMSSAIAGVRDIRTVVAGRAAANGLSGVPHVGHRVLRR